MYMMKNGMPMSLRSFSGKGVPSSKIFLDWEMFHFFSRYEQHPAPFVPFKPSFIWHTAIRHKAPEEREHRIWHGWKLLRDIQGHSDCGNWKHGMAWKHGSMLQAKGLASHWSIAWAHQRCRWWTSIKRWPKLSIEVMGDQGEGRCDGTGVCDDETISYLQQKD